MQTTIEGQPSFGYLNVDLSPGESIIAENDAMSSMSAGIELKAKTNGGFFSALGKKFLGGETFFVNLFKNDTDQDKRVTFSRPTPGDLREHQLDGKPIFLQKTAFLARTDEVKLSLKWAGLRSAIAKEGLFRLMASGRGKIWFGSYGGILERSVDGEVVVDGGHLVAYDRNIKMSIKMAGGLISSLFGGEGLVTHLRGKGKVYIQTRSLTGLAGWLNPRFR